MDGRTDLKQTDTAGNARPDVNESEHTAADCASARGADHTRHHSEAPVATSTDLLHGEDHGPSLSNPSAALDGDKLTAHEAETSDPASAPPRPESADPGPSGSGAPLSPKSSGRRRKPTAVAMAASEQALEGAQAKGKSRQRRKASESGGVSRTSHGGVKIGGRAVTWVGGAGMSREVLDKMGIPQLRALFLKTFNHPTGSNNAEWLRKKLAQPQDPQVGAARAAVPRARDVSAEIWTTGTTFKGFTKQERFKLQQMGGNCAAKVVEVIRDAPNQTPPEKVPGPKRRKKPLPSENTKMQIIGAETFEMPPAKRLTRAPDGHIGDGTHGGLLFDPNATDLSAGAMLNVFPNDVDSHGLNGQTPIVQQQHAPWRALQMSDAHMLQRGVNVKVYRADERWHNGMLENITYHGAPPNQTVMVQIYYWEHDQSEERPLEEFFRGESNSLIQWQPPQMTSLPVAGMPVQGLHMSNGGGFSGLSMQGIPVQGLTTMQPNGSMPNMSNMFAPPQQHQHAELTANQLGGGILRLST